MSALFDLRRPVGAYLIANDRDPQPCAGIASDLRASGWSIEQCAGGHSLMLTRSEVVVRLLTTLRR